MKALKIVLVLMIISLQVNATGYSHNMLVAQKMLKTRRTVSKSQALPLQFTTQPTVVKPASCPVSESAEEEAALKPESAAASFSQHVARWIVRIVSSQGKILSEKLVSLFSPNEKVEEWAPLNARFISISQNIVSYLVAPVRTLI
ncbi:hypothetical protein [Salmonirosea aquatica]|uniref:Uncharacterized protein n=1 Tax=Salmonirosea aquatica TaxID=2654236 RepID=A0A7C9BJH4_9BACT|nr:hypothetical protein [Cytophagaceae bacterium SJW1-29]